MAAKKHFDIYETITDKIINQLKAGTIPWEKPWINALSTSSTQCAISYTTGKPYSMLNQMMLGRPGEYVTFKQAQKLGGHVKKGAKGNMVVFWKSCLYENQNGDTDENGNLKLVSIPVLKYYNVFSLNECEGLEPKYEKEDLPENPNPATPDEQSEAIAHGYLGKFGITLQHMGNRAFYTAGADEITLPEMKMFTSTPDYYSTLFHEMVHSTGHNGRLNRVMSARQGTKSYAREELIAELGASALIFAVGLETERTFSNNAAYVESWIKALENDKKAIVIASGKAQKAVDLILGNDPEIEIEENS